MSDMKLERKIEFEPAWDKRHTDDNKNYGIHAVMIKFLLIGDSGAVQFYFSTGIHGRSVREEYKTKNYTLEPMGYDVGFHSQEPMDYQKDNESNECCYTKSGTCYYDGSGLRANKWLEIFIAEGDEKIWEMLEEYYIELFGETK